MNELNINILSAYLPNTLDKLRIQTNTGRVVELDGISNSINFLGRQGMAVSEYGISTAKPLLRPMSDLLNYMDNHLTIDKINTLLLGDYTFELLHEYFTIENNRSHHVPFHIYEQVRKELLYDKFDLFGLIDKGLALPCEPNTYVYPFDKLVK